MAADCRCPPDERSRYDDLRDNCTRAGLRLEQEYLGFPWLPDRLQRFLDGTTPPDSDISS